jgi:hypothetical protein
VERARCADGARLLGQRPGRKSPFRGSSTKTSALPIPISRCW